MENLVFVFPTFVGPQPCPRISENRFFHDGRVAIGDFEFGQFVGAQGYFPYSRFVVSAFNDFDIEVKNGEICFTGDFLEAGQYGRVLREESSPNGVCFSVRGFDRT